jgi:hypothetical protein
MPSVIEDPSAFRLPCVGAEIAAVLEPREVDAEDETRFRTHVGRQLSVARSSDATLFGHVAVPLLIALGGALGSLARYLLAGLVHRFASPYFPYGTFVVPAQPRAHVESPPPVRGPAHRD